MRRLLESGAAFMIVALICFLAGLIAERGRAFIPIGAFWMVFAIIVRSRHAKNRVESEDE